MDRFARYSWFVLSYNLAVILWGAAVRATGSGAGCGSHWPLCNGEVVPRAPRIETLIEFSHRVTSGLALLFVVGLVVVAFRGRPRGHAGRKAALWSLFFIFSEAAVGAGLVLFEMVADNQSMARALWMGAHLINTFFLVAALTLTVHFAGGGAPFRLRGQGSAGGWLTLGFVGLLLAGLSGSVAALGDTLFPAASLSDALRQDLSATAHLLIRLRVFHTLLSVTAGFLVLYMALQLPERRKGEGTTRYARWTMAVVLLQLAAGVMNVLLLAPVWMQLIHLLLADLLWIGFVLFSASVLAARGEVAVDATPEPAGAVG
jgi:heme A synthase